MQDFLIAGRFNTFFREEIIDFWQSKHITITQNMLKIILKGTIAKICKACPY